MNGWARVNVKIQGATVVRSSMIFPHPLPLLSLWLQEIDEEIIVIIKTLQTSKIHTFDYCHSPLSMF